MSPVCGNNFQDLELILDNNVRRVLSSSSSQRQPCLPRTPPPPTARKTEKNTISSEKKSQPNPMPNPILGAASISLALGSMVSSGLHVSRGCHSRGQLRMPPASARLGKSGKLPPPPPPLSAALPASVRSSTAPVQSSLASVRSSLSLETPPPKLAPKSTTSAFPDYFQLRDKDPNPADPYNGAALRKAAIVWFRNDLRIHDNEALSAANNEATAVLPVYCFDPRDYGKSSSGFDKTGPYRATFLLQCVANLRANLREKGSDLLVRIGKPEEVLVELSKSVGADALYAHQEVSHDEIRAEQKITTALKDEGVETKFFWGSTLYHLEDLPFKLEEMPSNYGGFREKVQNLAVRQTIQEPKRLKGLPVRGNVEPGKIPSLLDLGLSPQAAKGQGGKSTANASLVGGEAEALQRLKSFATECRGPPNNVGKDSSGDSLYGANFSCKISPWLAMGCLSPRYMFEELKKTKKRPVSSSLGKTSGSDDGGLNWLVFELLWRDFFRFITKKYSSAKKNLDAVPATACTGALAV